jgi:hypothetical protein
LCKKEREKQKKRVRVWIFKKNGAPNLHPRMGVAPVGLGYMNAREKKRIQGFYFVLFCFNSSEVLGN